MIRGCGEAGCKLIVDEGVSTVDHVPGCPFYRTPYTPLATRPIDREYSQELLTQLLWALYSGNRSDATNALEALGVIVHNDGPLPPVLASWIAFRQLAGFGDRGF